MSAPKVEDVYGPAPLVALELVEWRVDGKPNQGAGGPMARYVPYIDAARVAALLDEWVNPTNWRASYEPAKLAGQDVLWGIVEIRVGLEWVAKRDVGVASSFEKAKGLVSDAFKRAGCRMWGAGRNVYELPTLKAPCRIWIPPGRAQDGGPKEPQAFPTDDTLPSILSQLKALNYDANGGRVAGTNPDFDPDHDDLPADSPERVAEPPQNRAENGNRPRSGTVAKKAAAGRPEVLSGSIGQIRKQVRARFDKLPPAGQQSYVKAFGQPEDLTASKVRQAGPALVAFEMTAASAPPAADVPDIDAERLKRLAAEFVATWPNADLEATLDSQNIAHPDTVGEARALVAGLVAEWAAEETDLFLTVEELKVWWEEPPADGEAS